MTPTPSQAMLAAMRQHIETVGIRDIRKLDRALEAAWIAADRVRQDEERLRGFAGMNTIDTMPKEWRDEFFAECRRVRDEEARKASR